MVRDLTGGNPLPVAQLALPEFMKNGPDWWLERINFLLGEWGHIPHQSRSTLEEAYGAALEHIPCGGSAGCHPCANCQELGFKCMDATRPYMRVKFSRRGKEVQFSVIYSDGRKFIKVTPLEEGDEYPPIYFCSICGSDEHMNRVCKRCGHYGTFKTYDSSTNE